MTLSRCYYKNRVTADLILKQNYTSIMELPSFHKITCSNSSKEYILDKKNIFVSMVALELITGQKVKYNVAKKSIAGFKLRQNQVIGCNVTLRKNKMYTFFEKFIFSVAGGMRNFTQKKLNFNNYDITLTNFNLFFELQRNYEIFRGVKGIGINLIAKVRKKEDASLLYSAMQLPVKIIK
ncbi:50S ribosomal protein L5 [Paenibacillus sp. MAHUQ-46]|uniref:50S ribosomal protein L5 n=1 Tax=Paenibacillus roseus TaxID=2798579 RepID=A0A934J7G3_9BACL|nr:50S ribosomal protein L5 [Paenibacillus roseus]MBJ6361775.1 50S ribosomal protein L5 [Paenibacillus roseus]